ncbi:DUF481 domain-containing protein [Ruficoccus sp. ZRK36]|uniref:DUF481 domain-containing protein n=1 Tax=Ruficoccus sp. ZRK36 TaxID=2866311 RepID=UPI001C73C269|nr:DUF481 domain-containing protein [Ruficoccus sp. ZRK36]QYY35427.1 DUF481 domain-containing protein [Ruficoccus sp. ZRK36]
MNFAKALLLAGAVLIGTPTVHAQWGEDMGLGFASGESLNVSVPTVRKRYSSDGQDWVTLVTGEKIMGKIISMDGGTLIISSKLLGTVSISWDQVVEIQSEKPIVTKLEDKQTYEGTVQLNDKVVQITAPDGQVKTVPKDEVVELGSAHKSELDNWSFSLGVGIDYETGNTEETEYSAFVDIKRETELTRFIIYYMGNYTITNNEVTQNDQLVTSAFDYFLSEKFFVRPAFLQYYRNPFQNIDFQGTIGAGVGYQFFRTSKLGLNVVAGPAYQATYYETVPTGASKSIHGIAAFVEANLHYQILSDLRLESYNQLFITNKNAGLVNGNFTTTLSYSMTNLLDLIWSLQWEYLAYPQVDSSGNTPKSTDITLTMGIGISY